MAQVAIFGGKKVWVHHVYIEKKGAMLYSYQGFYGGKDGPRSPYLGERTS